MASTSPFTIRPATTADAPSIATLGAHVFSITYGHSHTKEDLQSFLNQTFSISAIEHAISDKAESILIASDASKKLVGFAVLTRGTSEPCLSHLTNFVEMQRIYVHPEVQGSGIGKLLALKIEDLARQEKFKWMWLTVWDENFKAQKIYERMGYSKVGEGVFPIGGKVTKDWILLKEL